MPYHATIRNESFTFADLRELLAKANEEQMFQLRFRMSMGQADGLKKYRELRKDRARILTILRERQGK